MNESVNLVPMAGAGQRFVDAGYSVPKPLVPIDGLPMIVRAAKSLPSADRRIFVCRKDHLVEVGVDDVLARYFEGPEFVVAESLTEGQACTCLLARDLLDQDARLTIGGL